jgi:hypothetical protein
VELNSSECSDDNWCISKNIKEEIAKSVHNIHLLDVSNKVCNRTRISFRWKMVIRPKQVTAKLNKIVKHY